MSLKADLSSLDEVASRLPFAVSDYEAVNATFKRWMERDGAEEYDVLVTWVYCYSRRFLITKAIRHREASASDVEALISRAFQKAIAHMGDVREPGKFAGYVSVICKRTYIDHYRRRTGEKERGGDLHFELDPDSLLSDPDALDPLDREMLREAISRAMEGMPEMWQRALLMRYFERLSYKEIASTLDYPTGTLRAYVYKAICKLREDPHLGVIADEWFDRIS